MTTKTYMLLCPSARLVKIGQSKNPAKRMLNLRTMNAAEVEPLLVLKVSEAWLHERFAGLRHHGEWFHVHADLADYLDLINEHEAADRLNQILENESAPKNNH